MGRFAWRNLMTRPLRTVLALIGLSIPILGVIGLYSVSGSLRDLVGATLNKIQGLMVLREGQPSPVFSDLPANLADKLRAIPGVRVVAPEIWRISPPVDGKIAIGKNILKKDGFAQAMAQSILDMPIVQGQDIAAHMNLKSAVYPRALLPASEGGGRYLEPSDAGKNVVVISTKIAREHPGADGKPKRVGDSILIGGTKFEIVGLYSTGSMFLDVVIVMDIDAARRLISGVSPESVSSFYVETDDPARNDAIAETIEREFRDVDARSMSEFQANFGMLMGQLDKFLLMTVSLALLVGVVGIINTMLMSTTERFVEFGVLRTNGWSKRDVLTLVTAESAFLGLLSGLLGCVLAFAGATIANQFITGGLRLSLPLWLLGLGIGLSVVTGTLGGLYPAWRAARLVPMEAIRAGGSR